MFRDAGLILFLKLESSLAGPTLQGPMSPITHGAVGNSRCSALTVANEVEDHHHLLVEAQRFDRDGLRTSVWSAVLGLDCNLEMDLEAGGKFEITEPFVRTGQKFH